MHKFNEELSWATLPWAWCLISWFQCTRSLIFSHEDNMHLSSMESVQYITKLHVFLKLELTITEHLQTVSVCISAVPLLSRLFWHLGMIICIFLVLPRHISIPIYWINYEMIWSTYCLLIILNSLLIYIDFNWYSLINSGVIYSSKFSHFLEERT